jgi:hypothetical protein
MGLMKVSVALIILLVGMLRAIIFIVEIPYVVESRVLLVFGGLGKKKGRPLPRMHY